MPERLLRKRLTARKLLRLYLLPPTSSTGSTPPPKTSNGTDTAHQPHSHQSQLHPPKALQTLVILVNQFLIPHFNADPRFSRNSHAGRIIWLQNLMKTRHGQSLMEQAVARLSSELGKDLEEKRKKLREFRPVSPFEWKDAGTDIRYYDDPIDGKWKYRKMRRHDLSKPPSGTCCPKNDRHGRLVVSGL